MECSRKRSLRIPRNLPSRFHCTVSPSHDQPLVSLCSLVDIIPSILFLGCYSLVVIPWLLFLGCYCLVVIAWLLLLGCYCLVVIALSTKTRQINEAEAENRPLTGPCLTHTSRCYASICTHLSRLRSQESSPRGRKNFLSAAGEHKKLCKMFDINKLRRMKIFRKYFFPPHALSADFPA
jgi:hypothetical protein